LSSSIIFLDKGEPFDINDESVCMIEDIMNGSKIFVDEIDHVPASIETQYEEEKVGKKSPIPGSIF
jgi:hypothetical protein